MDATREVFRPIHSAHKPSTTMLWKSLLLEVLKQIRDLFVEVGILLSHVFDFVD